MRSSVTAELFKIEDWGTVAAVEGLSSSKPSAEALTYVQERGLALTLRNAVGVAVAILGMRVLGARRVEAWAVVDFNRTMREFSDITRIAKQYLDSWDADRVEAFTECDFKAGHVWLRHLGFTLEASCMRRYLANGKDCALYARVRGVDGQWESPK